MERHRYVITYDITENRIRNKAASVLLDFGIRVQKSVFECRLKPEDLELVLERLKSLIDMETDSVIVYRLCAFCGALTKYIGNNVPFESGNEDFRIL